MFSSPPVLTTFQRLEQNRIIAAAQDAYLERGIAAVSMAGVAFTLRLPLATVEAYFPAGELGLLRAALVRHTTSIHQQLRAHQADSSTAVEELLAMRRFLHQQMSDTRSLFFQELAAGYPLLWRYGQRIRSAFMRAYLQENLRRGMREGLYQAGLPEEKLAVHWLAQLDTGLRAARTASEAVEVHYQQVNEWLAGITTPPGAYVVRRLQEAFPYY